MTDAQPQQCTPPARGARGAGRDVPALLIEEKICAALLVLMVVLVFLQAVVRNCGPLARTALGGWIAHAVEVLPSGLTWVTFLACGAVTRRDDLLRVDVIRQRLRPALRRRLAFVLWGLWAALFGILLVLGGMATYAQRKQMTSIEWLPAWAVSLSIPLGAGLVIWRTVQNLVDLKRGRGPGQECGASSGPGPG